jgi:hypothetical protein
MSASLANSQAILRSRSFSNANEPSNHEGHCGPRHYRRRQNASTGYWRLSAGGGHARNARGAGAKQSGCHLLVERRLLAQAAIRRWSRERPGLGRQRPCLRCPKGNPYDFNAVNNLPMADRVGKVVTVGKMLRNGTISVSELKGLETYNPATYAPCCCDSE